MAADIGSRCVRRYTTTISNKIGWQGSTRNRTTHLLSTSKHNKSYPHWTAAKIQHRSLRLKTPSPLASSANDDVELAVFRFTLGIPGFNDNLIPRVVGILAGFALIANHVASSQDTISDAQQRAELLGAALSALCIITPSIGDRLEELKPGKGRKATDSNIEGAKNIFALAPVDDNEQLKQELAWSSYALMLNTNICGLLIISNQDDQALALRGALSSNLGTDPSNALQLASKAWSKLSSDIKNPTNAVYLQDRAAIDRTALSGCTVFIPNGVQSAFIQPLVPLENGNDSKGVLVLLSERERALSRQERAWASAIAAKLSNLIT